MSKEAILEAAAQIIREKGYHAASMADIANAVDLSKATLYSHIDSKQAILVALLDQALETLIEDIQPVLTANVPADEKFRRAMHAFLSYMSENLDLSAVLLLEHRSLDPEKRGEHIPRRDEYESYWRQIIEEGVAEGIFTVEDPSLSAKVALGVASWTVMWFNPQGRLSAEQIADQSADILLEGFYKR
ncbi:MAG: TetR family transcriptional regulator [Anaerolineales bacterium]|nr:TetR family transcriptional regulator [Anaerolineales bacterium]